LARLKGHDAEVSTSPTKSRNFCRGLSGGDALAEAENSKAHADG